MPQPYQKATLPRPSNAQQSRTTVQTATVSQAPEKRGGDRGASKARKGRSEAALEWRKLYNTREWRDRLRPNQLAKEPLCAFCKIAGRVTAATVVDHRENHKGDPALFFDPENLQSVCAPCHDRVKDQIERHGYHTMSDAYGYPMDKNHPANQ